MVNSGQDRLWPFAEGGTATVIVSTLIVGLAVLLRRIWPSWLNNFLLFLLLPVWLLILYFFRDPNRKPIQGQGVVASPGDGKVVEIVHEREEHYLDRDVIRISIFLSLFDVHVQRTPISGVVQRIHHKPGRFLQAFRAEASQLNEYIALQLESEYGPVLVKQIAGILARRCVNYAKVGEYLETGQRFGMIRFSSRVDLFLPPEAEICIGVGDIVYGGLTPIANLHPINKDVK